MKYGLLFSRKGAPAEIMIHEEHFTDGHNSTALITTANYNAETPSQTHTK